MAQYNKKRHLELLKKREEKSISSSESKELCNYSALLDRQLDWETRDQYLQLLKEFIEGKIDIGEFLRAFKERGQLNGKVLDILEYNLILLEPHEKSLDFLDFIQQILQDCEIYNPDPEPFRYEY